MIVTSENLNEALVALVRHGLARIDRAMLVEIAKALWYSSEIPSPYGMPPQYREDVCYVIDRLARFNVLSKSRKLQLLATIENFRRETDFATVALGQDPLAVSWGASGDLTRFLPDLLPYQTRHYAASQAHPAM